MKKLPAPLHFFFSVRLAILLIVILISLSLIAAFIPQNLTLAEYQKLYAHTPDIIVMLIFRLGLHRFFRSVLFFVPAGLFFINLTLCTVDRFFRQLTSGTRKKRFGPDIVHLGLMILLIGGLVSLFTRNEDFAWLSRGDQVRLPGNRIITVESIEYLNYADGRPMDYLTRVRITGPDEQPGEFTIEVNKPLTIGFIMIYQNSYQERFLIEVKDPAGKIIKLTNRQELKTPEGSYLFKALRPINKEEPGSSSVEYAAVFDRISRGEPGNSVEITAGKSLDGYLLQETSQIAVTGLSFVRDYGIIPVWIGIILLLSGLCWTYIQKIGENNNQ